MKDYKKLISIILCLILSFYATLVLADGEFAYSGEFSLFSEDFENLISQWNNDVGVSLYSILDKNVMKLTGENKIMSINQVETNDCALSAQIYLDKSSTKNGGYSGLAVRITENGDSYQLRLFPNESLLKLVKIQSEGYETVLANKSINIADSQWHEIKIAAKDSIIRCMIDGAVIMSVFDENAISGRGTAVISHIVTSYFDKVKIETESSYYYENFENGLIHNLIGNQITPVTTKADLDGEWVVSDDNGAKVLTTKGYSKMASIVYPMPKADYSKSSAAILNVKSDAWSIAGDEGGFAIYARYNAGNMNYRALFHDNLVELQKIEPSENITSLKKSDTLKLSYKSYYEIAFEAINNSGGTVTLNVYIDGNLAVTAADAADVYQSGDFAIEYNGEVRPYIDDINFISIDPQKPLYILYSEGRQNKDIDVFFNEEEIDCQPILENNQILMSAEQLCGLIEAEITINDGKIFEFTKSGLTITLEAGKSTGRINGDEVDTLASSRVENGVFIVPVRFAVEAFGAIVSYNKDNKILEITYDSADLGEGDLYTKDGIIFQISNDGKALNMLKIMGNDVVFKGEGNTPLWNLYFADDAVKTANKTIAQTGIFYFQRWETGSCCADSTASTLKSKYWDKESGVLTLNYTHADADVTVVAKFNGKTIDFDATVINKSSNPLQFITVPSKWTLYHSKNNTFLTPQPNYAMEYENIVYATYDLCSAYDGFIATGDNPFALYSIQGEKGVYDRPILGTTSYLRGPSTNSGKFTVETGTIVWKEKGETARNVKTTMGVYDDLRTFSNAYIQRNYPDTKTIREKIPEDVRDIVPKSYLFYIDGTSFSNFEKLLDYLPGHAQFHVGTSMHANTNEYGTWDAFPNYFPPSANWGTMENMRNFIQHAREQGHTFMPRNSLYYYTYMSDIANKYGGENLAIKRLDGEPQKVAWGLPGWIYSPSSRQALAEKQSYYDTWKSLGATTFFTNVVAVISPYGYRYDFNSDAEAPDQMYDAIMNELKWYGDKIPLFSEGGSGIRIPYQVGFMNHVRWDEESECDSYLLDANTRGTPVRVRHDIVPLLESEYVRYYPHNVGTEGQWSFRAATYSLLYNHNFKMYLSAYNPMQNSKWQWIRAQAILSELVSDRLFGAKLMSEIERDTSGVERANYSGNIVTGNLTNEPLTIKNNKIAAQGFDFQSEDGLVSAGAYTIYNGHRFDEDQLIIRHRDEGKLKIYAPLATKDFEICVDTEDIEKPQLTAYYPDGTTTNIDYIQTAKGIIFNYPYFDPALTNAEPMMVNGSEYQIKSSKIIPYVEITESETAAGDSLTNPIIIQAELSNENYTSMITMPETVTGSVRVENFTNKAITGTISLNGEFFGKPVDITLDVNTSDVVTVLPFELHMESDSIDTGAYITLTQNGINPLEMTETLSIERMQYPELENKETIESKFNLAVDWDMNDTNALEGVNFNAVGATNPYGIGYNLKPGEYLTFGGDNLKYTKKLYFEVLIKFNDLRNYISGEHMIIKADNAKNGYGNRTIEFRYIPAVDQFRLLVTSATKFSDISCKTVEPKINEWYHIIVSYDGETQRISVNGSETTLKTSMDDFLTYSGFKVGGSIDADISYIRIGGE